MKIYAANFYGLFSLWRWSMQTSARKGTVQRSKRQAMDKNEPVGRVTERGRNWEPPLRKRRLASSLQGFKPPKPETPRKKLKKLLPGP